MPTQNIASTTPAVESKSNYSYFDDYTLGYDKDNKKISLKESEHGFVEASLDKGTYKLSFKKTLAYRICIYISLITLIGIILYLVFRKVRH